MQAGGLGHTMSMWWGMLDWRVWLPGLMGTMISSSQAGCSTLAMYRHSPLYAADHSGSATGTACAARVLLVCLTHTSQLQEQAMYAASTTMLEAYGAVAGAACTSPPHQNHRRLQSSVTKSFMMSRYVHCYSHASR